MADVATIVTNADFRADYWSTSDFAAYVMARDATKKAVSQKVA